MLVIYLIPSICFLSSVNLESSLKRWNYKKHAYFSYWCSKRKKKWNFFLLNFILFAVMLNGFLFIRASSREKNQRIIIDTSIDKKCKKRRGNEKNLLSWFVYFHSISLFCQYAAWCQRQTNKLWGACSKARAEKKTTIDKNATIRYHII